jgi:hypothetical protein
LTKCTKTEEGRLERERESRERENKFEGRERKLQNFEERGRQFSRGREDVGRDEWNLNFF